MASAIGLPATVRGSKSFSPMPPKVSVAKRFGAVSAAASASRDPIEKPSRWARSTPR